MYSVTHITYTVTYINIVTYIQFKVTYMYNVSPFIHVHIIPVPRGIYSIV